MGRVMKVQVDVKKLAMLYKPTKRGGGGLSLRQISEKIGISHEQVRILLEPLDIVRRHEKHHVTPVMARKMLKKCGTYRAMAEKLGINTSYAFRLANNLPNNEPPKSIKRVRQN